MRYFLYILISFLVSGCAEFNELLQPLKQNEVSLDDEVKTDSHQKATQKLSHQLKVVNLKIASKSIDQRIEESSVGSSSSVANELSQEIPGLSEVVEFEHENFDEVVNLFVNNCKTSLTRKLYGSLCDNALHVSDKKVFIKENFRLYKVVNEQSSEGVLTGYYEPELHGSLTKHGKYIYPLYEKPKPIDMNMSIFGSDNNISIPNFLTREEHNELNTPVLCYVDDKVEAFFLEIQGSGRIKLDTNETMFIGYSGNNGKQYASVGKYMIDKGYMSANHMSLQDIKWWAKKNPDKLNEVLNYNQRVVYFKKRDSTNVTGSLGIPLTPMRSVAVDSKYIPLGSMLLIDAKDYKHSIKNIVFAQDRGAAIKSAVRADLFTGYGQSAYAIAGNLKAKLKMWIFLPKNELR
jgi:membrane-bound lytic murein transglycosylase A